MIGRDIRKQGSGNAGATNMTRVFGWAAGIATLIFDVLKAIAAMMIGRAMLGDTGICLGGMGSLVGHCWPVFHRFKGGKGISVGAAVGLMIDWRVFAVIITAFLIAALLSKKVSVGSLCAALAVVPATLVFAPRPPQTASCRDRAGLPGGKRNQIEHPAVIPISDRGTTDEKQRCRRRCFYYFFCLFISRSYFRVILTPIKREKKG